MIRRGEGEAAHLNSSAFLIFKMKRPLTGGGGAAGGGEGGGCDGGGGDGGGGEGGGASMIGTDLIGTSMIVSPQSSFTAH